MNFYLIRQNIKKEFTFFFILRYDLLFKLNTYTYSESKINHMCSLCLSKHKENSFLICHFQRILICEK